MGIVVQFPEGQRPLGGGRYVDLSSEPADIIILPVVRIERFPDQPSDIAHRMRRRRRVVPINRVLDNADGVA